ncbi:CDK5 regulatory subunit-associated protein 3 isoform X2 [Protopterus annectens]|uniref:CDK5 regulatory subunit-associated protein 3 isoform X2 n=1 Tax=Protopterus annectens TaxID=7888 RepID=UPI001CFA4B8E|nr:CDK5 regulatory subunit-associated protein 3 isoform X2 [Protopterus annectens]
MRTFDWLVDRRHCSLKWQNSVLTIREKIKAAMQDMPENEEIGQLLSGTYIHYFHCLRIVEILKGTEASTKNIFGRYSSQRMKDWQEILSLYEKDNAYLAEISSFLVRNVSYEIPSLKKQIAKCQQLQQEYGRKEVECVNGASDLREKFYTSCKKYGITGDNIKKELLALVKDLPSSLGGMIEGVCSLSEAIELYQACVNFICESPSEVVVPMLRCVLQKGNITVYEWKTGICPSVIERPQNEEPLEQVTEDTIDWGDFGSISPANTETTGYGISLDDAGQAEDIDWGISVQPIAQEASSDGIDWGDDEATPVEIEVVEAGSEDGTARGPDALSLLENPDTRNQFIDELMELEVFLSQRLIETNEEADVLAVCQFQTAPAILQNQTADKMTTVLTTVKALLDQLTNQKMQHLFLIHASPRYVDRVTELLHQKLKQADQLLLKQQVLIQKRQDALAEQAALEPKLDLLIQRTKEFQKLIEADISKRYSQRPVNLMGVTV